MSNVTYQIKATFGTTETLTGIGEEWILDPVDNTVIARFWNGNFVTSSSSSLSPQGDVSKDADTLVLSEAA